MSDGDFLSQGDIDALMQNLNGPGEGAEAPVPGIGGEPEATPAAGPETLRPAVEMILRQAATVVTTVLNKNADFALAEVAPATAANVYGSGGGFKSRALSLRVGFSAGLSGALYYTLSEKDAAILADLMMMGDGSAAYTEDHQEALAELTNQIMGASSTAMGTEYGTSISCEQAQAVDYGEGNLPFAPEGCFVARVTLKIEDFPDSEILLVIDPPLAETLAAFYTHAEAKSAAAAVSGAGAPLTSSDTSLMASQPAGKGMRPFFTSTGNANVDLLLDVPLDVTIELGRTEYSIRRVLELGPGSIIELDRKASEPVDLLVNDKVVAKGEVVVVDEYFGIRVVSLVTPEERIKFLK